MLGHGNTLAAMHYWLVIVLTVLLPACSSSDGATVPTNAEDAAASDALPFAPDDAAEVVDVSGVPDVAELPPDSAPATPDTAVPDTAVPDTAVPDTAGPMACNGAVALCDRRYDEVCYPMTHNAMSNEAAGWIMPNQTFGLTRQLEDGVRGMMLDVHPFEGQVYLCHGLCEIGKQLLVDGLTEITVFLEAHPHEVVSIIFEPYVTPAEIEKAMQDAGLVDLLFTHVAGEPWPTLASLIAKNTRLVVFTESDGGDPAWYMPAWTWISDTNYAAKVPADLTCALNRGPADAPLFLINSFLTNPLASQDLAKTVNFNPFLQGRATDCAAARGRMPNFIGVDFYDIGDVFAVVRQVNGLEPL